MLSLGDGGASLQVRSGVELDAVLGKVQARGLDGEGTLCGDVLVLAPVPPTGGGEDALLTVSARGIRRHYRGALLVRITSGDRLLAVNEVDVEDYLRGVVPAEMSTAAPPEALKAQAIVARTYALRLRGRYRSDGFDLTDDTACQVYGGADAETSASDAAVRDTAGVVLVRDHRLILSDYYDDCGGVTAEGDGPDDYPPSVRDAPPGGPDYCARGKYHTWDLRLTPDELRRMLAKAFPGQISGAVEDVSVADVDRSGRARSVAVRTGRSTLRIRGSQFRTAIGPGRLRSTLFTVAHAPDGAFLFTGRGYGHGHGMCQEGAEGMASNPYCMTHEQILQHYFPGAELAGDYGAKILAGE
ncbi:MAG: SpoIID/LytB domain-containing protein [Chthonomonadales bacterium]